MLQGRYGQFNQAGDLAPRTGPYGLDVQAHEEELEIALLPVVVPTARRGFNNFIGGIQVTNVNGDSVVGNTQYGGVAPAALQPTVARPLPWAPTTTPSLED